MGASGQPYRGFWNGPVGLVLLAVVFGVSVWLGWRVGHSLWTNGLPQGGAAPKGIVLGLVLPFVSGWALWAGLRSGWRRLNGR